MQLQDQHNIWEELGRPFSPEEVNLRVIATNKDKTRGLVVPYVDARAIMERLDSVVGVENWHDMYEPMGQVDTRVYVRCSLTVAGITKQDVGEGDDYKSACSDALKRAAVKFRLGRHLYNSEKIWAHLDQRGGIENEDAVKLRVLVEPSRNQIPPVHERDNGISHPRPAPEESTMRRPPSNERRRSREFESNGHYADPPF